MHVRLDSYHTKKDCCSAIVHVVFQTPNSYSCSSPWQDGACGEFFKDDQSIERNQGSVEERHQRFVPGLRLELHFSAFDLFLRTSEKGASAPFFSLAAGMAQRVQNPSA